MTQSGHDFLLCPRRKERVLARDFLVQKMNAPGSGELTGRSDEKGTLIHWVSSS
jgi:hypothetical protein